MKILMQDPVNLANPYSVIAVNPKKNKKINYTGVNKFIDWLISTKGQEAIAGYKHNGMQLYIPIMKNKL